MCINSNQLTKSCRVVKLTWKPHVEREEKKWKNIDYEIRPSKMREKNVDSSMRIY